RVEHLDAAAIVLGERRLALHEVQRGALLGARLGEQQRAGREVEGSEPVLLGDRGGCPPLARAASGAPPPAAGNHLSRPETMRCRTRKSSSSSANTMRLPRRRRPTTR